MLVDCQPLERDRAGSRPLPHPTCPDRQGLLVGESTSFPGQEKRNLPYNSEALIK